MSHLLLIRHAHAGDRSTWRADDRERPLSPRGRLQAAGLVTALSGYDLGAVLSSPAVRCEETVAPLAASRRLALQPDDRLLEGADPAAALAWLEEIVRAQPAAACTHGDLVPAVLDAVRAQGATLPAEVRWAKGSTWVLSRQGGRWTAAAYVPPPA